MDALGHIFYRDIPEGMVRVDSIIELLQLKENKRAWKKANTELIDTFILIYSPDSERYWQRALRGSLEADIQTLVGEGRVYMSEQRKPTENDTLRRRSYLNIEHMEKNRSSIDGVATKIKKMKQTIKKLDDGSNT